MGVKDEQAEGIVCLILTSTADEYDRATTLAQGIHEKKLVFVVCEPTLTLNDALQDYVALLDVLTSETALASDQVAQREVRDRVVEAEEVILRWMNESFVNFKTE